MEALKISRCVCVFRDRRLFTRGCLDAANRSAKRACKITCQAIQIGLIDRVRPDPARSDPFFNDERLQNLYKHAEEDERVSCSSSLLGPGDGLFDVAGIALKLGK